MDHIHFRYHSWPATSLDSTIPIMMSALNLLTFRLLPMMHSNNFDVDKGVPCQAYRRGTKGTLVEDHIHTRSQWHLVVVSYPPGGLHTTR